MRNIASLVLNYSTLLGGGRSSRVNGRTLRVRNFKHFLLLVSAIALIGCEGSKNDPFVDPGDTPNPNWTLTVENDLSSSMTAIVRVSFTEKEGVLAAFVGDDCCGVTSSENFVDGLYYLYISPSEKGEEIRLKFYSPDLKRIFISNETFLFRNDTQLGSVAKPVVPTFAVEQ